MYLTPERGAVGVGGALTTSGGLWHGSWSFGAAVIISVVVNVLYSPAFLHNFLINSQYYDDMYKFDRI